MLNSSMCRTAALATASNSAMPGSLALANAQTAFASCCTWRSDTCGSASGPNATNNNACYVLLCFAMFLICFAMFLLCFAVFCYAFAMFLLCFAMGPNRPVSLVATIFYYVYYFIIFVLFFYYYLNYFCTIF